MTATYPSRQDFAARMAAMSKTSLWLHDHLPRTLAFDSQTAFERHLHDSMGWKSSTVNDWES